MIMQICAKAVGLYISVSHLEIDLSPRDGSQQLVMVGNAGFVGNFRLLQFPLIVTGDLTQRQIRLVRHVREDRDSRREQPA